MPGPRAQQRLQDDVTCSWTASFLPSRRRLAHGIRRFLPACEHLSNPYDIYYGFSIPDAVWYFVSSERIHGIRVVIRAPDCLSRGKKMCFSPLGGNDWPRLTF